MVERNTDFPSCENEGTIAQPKEGFIKSRGLVDNAIHVGVMGVECGGAEFAF
jgi:hypothetical protein